MGSISINKKFPGTSPTLIPDLVLRGSGGKTVIVDFTVAFEDRYESLVAARNGKIFQYQPILESLRAAVKPAYLNAIAVGALASWDPANDTVLLRFRAATAPDRSGLTPHTSSVFCSSAVPSRFRHDLLRRFLQLFPQVKGRKTFEIMSRFRTHKYAFTTDIQMIFRQILIDPAQRDLRIMWKTGANEEPVIYR
ncbi:hypothetical protein TNCV_3826901 [Trichonephila clavipes]|nr:hypothetical protein TNCV_3826901 [Trichonephila clavipes]